MISTNLPAYDYDLVEIKTSNIYNAGRGVFAIKPIMKGQQISKYQGYLDTTGNTSVEYQKYGIHTPRGVLIGKKDICKVHDGVAQLINDPLCNVLNPGCFMNSYFTLIGDEMFAIASRDIHADEEIYVSYGFKYWESSHNHHIVDNMSDSERRHFQFHTQLEGKVIDLTKRSFLASCLTTIPSSLNDNTSFTRFAAAYQQLGTLRHEGRDHCSSDKYIVDISLNSNQIEEIYCYECMASITL